ncbi:interferon regulatory factor 4-like isoform X1 [Astyanax mexicanus]|uniref:Interferon regulatory factor 4-like isoform X1 n=1 Tax=Astyanax mexicanus TaxID=7994 RepID=A0A8T2LT76_ASTMX|nr:interferon regulatory factor 4-like isoform X1 [Astyanax mexicanus]
MSGHHCRMRPLAGMNLDGDCSMSVSCGNGKLRQWLIEQIDSGEYPGLVWENDEKTIFRIPWKHAGKQDYNRDEDAALFKAWALFKGKYREGVDKPDPPTWKTRLRCALNKSNDFDELVERSQLDISDPYKVYRIIPEGAKRGAKSNSIEDTSAHVTSLGYSTYPLQPQMSSYMLSQERRDWRDYGTDHPHHQPPHAELPYCPPYPPARPLQWHAPPCDNGYQISGSFYTYTPTESHPVSVDPSMRSAEAMAISDFRLHVSLYYRESLVKEVTTSSPEGCRISSSSTPGSPSSPSSPCPEDRLYSGAEPVLFPFPYPQSQRRGADKLPNVLERGVLLWLTPDGLYAKRLCQGRVYWEGPLAPYSDKPNKLEKEQTCKLMDTQQFLSELQGYIHHGRPMPRYQVVLCFGDEYPDPQRQSKMITAQVEPMFARQLLYFAGQTNGHYLRGYELPSQGALPVEDYQRSLQHMQE